MNSINFISVVSHNKKNLVKRRDTHTHTHMPHQAPKPKSTVPYQPVYRQIFQFHFSSSALYLAERVRVAQEQTSKNLPKNSLSTSFSEEDNTRTHTHTLFDDSLLPFIQHRTHTHTSIQRAARVSLPVIIRIIEYHVKKNIKYIFCC